MASTQVRGKSFSLPGSTPTLLSVAVPTLLDFIDQTAINSNNSIVNVTIKSSSIYDVRLKDYSTGVLTDLDTVPLAGSLAIFSISNVSLLDIELTASTNPQTFYVYLSGEVS